MDSIWFEKLVNSVHLGDQFPRRMTTGISGGGGGTDVCFVASIATLYEK
jgi:hypothetical protein